MPTRSLAALCLLLATTSTISCASRPVAVPTCHGWSEAAIAEIHADIERKTVERMERDGIALPDEPRAMRESMERYLERNGHTPGTLAILRDRQTCHALQELSQ